MPRLDESLPKQTQPFASLQRQTSWSAALSEDTTHANAHVVAMQPPHVSDIGQDCGEMGKTNFATAKCVETRQFYFPSNYLHRRCPHTALGIDASF